MATKAEMMEQLQALGIEFNPKAKKDELQYILDTVALTVKVNCKMLNLREEPSKEAPVVVVLNKNDTLEVIGNSDEWVHVNFGELTGYVMAKFVR